MPERLFLADRTEAPRGLSVQYHRGKPYVERELVAQVPENAESIPSPAAAPEGGKVVQGPKGGWYYVPDGAEGAAEDAPGGTDTDTQEDLPDLSALMESDVPAVRMVADQIIEELSRNGEIRLGAPIKGSGDEILDALASHYPGEYVFIDGKPAFVERIDGDYAMFRILGGEQMVAWAVDFEEDDISVHEPPDEWKDLDGALIQDLLAQYSMAQKLHEFSGELDRFEERGGEVPPSLDIREAVALKSLHTSGINGGINRDAMVLAEMADGSRVFVKDYGSDEASIGNGEVAVQANRLVNELGVNAPLSVYDKRSGLFLAEGVPDATPIMKYRAGTLPWREVLRVVIAGLLVGNYDIHGGNIVVDGEGRLHIIDSDLAGASVWNRRDGAPTLSGRGFEAVVEYTNDHGGAATVELVNTMAAEMANGVDEEVLDEIWESDDYGPMERMAENIMLAQTHPFIGEKWAEELEERVYSPVEWQRTYGSIPEGETA